MRSDRRSGRFTDAGVLRAPGAGLAPEACALGAGDGLRCPACRAPLDPDGDAYACAGCGRGYPVRDGIPRLLPALRPGERQVQGAFDFEHARYRDSQRVRFRPQLVDEFCAHVQLPPAWFAGKAVLDAGCGSGRWSYALARMGARVTAVDLTDAGVRVTREALRPYPGCAVYQASIFALPFAPESFDFVVGWGVLHHTPDTRAAFERLVPLVRPGGVLYVMVYERTARRYRLLTDALRALLRRLPDRLRYRACAALVIQDPRLYRLISPWLKVCDGSAARSPLDRTTLVFDTFDAYSPRYNHVHTQSEVRRWFADAGFAGVALTHPVRYTSPAAIARWGECGGAVHVRGVKPGETTQPALPAPPVLQPAPAEAWLAGRQTNGHVMTDADSAAAAPALPPFDACWRDDWRGLSFRYPSIWAAQGRGAEVMLAPRVAIPPYQLGVHVSAAGRGAPLAVRATASFARWLPPDQRARLVHERTVPVAGGVALERRYVLRFGNVPALATFVYLEHGGALCQVYAIAGWEVPAAAGEEMAAALAALLETVELETARRGVRAAVVAAARYRYHLWRLPARLLAAGRPTVWTGRPGGRGGRA